MQARPQQDPVKHLAREQAGRQQENKIQLVRVKNEIDLLPPQFIAPGKETFNGEFFIGEQVEIKQVVRVEEDPAQQARDGERWRAGQAVGRAAGRDGSIDMRCRFHGGSSIHPERNILP